MLLAQQEMILAARAESALFASPHHRGSVVAIDSAVPRREEGVRTDDDLSTSSMVSLSRGLPSVPSIHSLGQVEATGKHLPKPRAAHARCAP